MPPVCGWEPGTGQVLGFSVREKLKTESSPRENLKTEISSSEKSSELNKFIYLSIAPTFSRINFLRISVFSFFHWPNPFNSPSASSGSLWEKKERKRRIGLVPGHSAWPRLDSRSDPEPVEGLFNSEVWEIEARIPAVPLVYIQSRRHLFDVDHASM
jgi:hypothetical protein